MAKTMLPARFSDDAGHIMNPAELKDIDIFENVATKQLERFSGTVVKRQFDAGDVICQEGEGGTTAFYIFDGEFEVFIDHRREKRSLRTGARGGLIAATGSALWSAVFAGGAPSRRPQTGAHRRIGRSGICPSHHDPGRWVSIRQNELFESGSAINHGHGPHG